jgi:heptosyltransferase-2
VDRAQSIEARALAGFFARNGQLAENLADYFSLFDIIISYLYDPDEIFQANVRRCSTAQFICGPHRAQEREKLHAAKVYLQPLERLAIFDADPVPRLKLDPVSSTQHPVSVSPIQHPPSSNQLALHPGSGSESKNWPEANWALLLEHLINSTQFNLLLVGGEAEGERLQRLAAALPPTRLKVAQSLPLAQLARRLQTCGAFIGHDSGISHLAAALGLPGLILWGETAEEIWRPPSEKMIVLRSPAGLAQLPAEEVYERLRKLLGPSN